MKHKGDLILKKNLILDEDLIVEGNIICEDGLWNIKARDIKARDIEAWDIKARDIEAWNIEAGNIDYWAVCYARESFKCNSVKGRRNNHKHFCLDNEIEYIDKPKTCDKCGSVLQ